MNRLFVCLFAGCLILGPLRLGAVDCFQGVLDEVRDEYYFIASSAQGAVGDVVAIDISLVVEKWPENFLSLIGFEAVCCFDTSKADLVPALQHSEEFDQLAAFTDFITLPRESSEVRGFRLSGVTRGTVAAAFFPAMDPVPLATVFLRLKGNVGDTFQLEFCDFQEKPPSCIRPYMYYASNTERERVIGLSTRHIPGEIRILPGEATHPDPPALPPPVKVYPEAPTAESASIRFELSGAAVQPEASEVPLHLYVTSNYEWSGFAVSLEFPSDLLELARVEEATRPGAVKIDNEKGFLGMYTTNSRRRLGAEGERLRVATLYFNLKPGAEEAGSITPTFEDVAPYANWLQIFHAGGASEDVPVSAEVSPVVVAGGLLKVQREPTAPGDVNMDYTLNLTDALALLGDLFLGTDDVLCPEASDFNGDASVNISDPVGILNYLFVGGSAPANREVYCGAGQ